MVNVNTRSGEAWFRLYGEQWIEPASGGSEAVPLGHSDARIRLFWSRAPLARSAVLVPSGRRRLEAGLAFSIVLLTTQWRQRSPAVVSELIPADAVHM